MNKLTALIKPKFNSYSIESKTNYFTLLSKRGMEGVFCLRLKINPSAGPTRFKCIEDIILATFPCFSTVRLTNDVINNPPQQSTSTPEPETVIDMLSNAQLCNYKKKANNKNESIKIMFSIPLTKSIFESSDLSIYSFKKMLAELSSYQQHLDFIFCGEELTGEGDYVAGLLQGRNTKSGLYKIDQWLGSNTHKSGNFLTITDTNSLASFDIFQGINTNKNLVLTSNAGGGGWFITQSIFTEHLKSQGKVFSIHNGYGNYEFKHLCRYQSNIIEKEECSINPLWNISTSLPTTLYSDFVVYLASIHHKVSNVDVCYLELAINEVIESKKQHLGITDVFDHLVAISKPEVAKLLDIFVNGKYKGLFDGKPFYNFDGQFIDADNEVFNHEVGLKSASMFSFIIQSLTNIITNESKSKDIIHISDAWNYIESHNDKMFESIVQSAERIGVCLFVSTQSIRDFTYYNHSCKSFSRFYRNANTEISSTQQPDAILESIKLGVVPLEQKSLRLKARLDRVQQKTNTFIRQGARFGSFHFCYSETFEKALSTAPKALEEKKDGIKKMGSIKSWLGSLEK